MKKTTMNKTVGFIGGGKITRTLGNEEEDIRSLYSTKREALFKKLTT